MISVGSYRQQPGSSPSEVRKDGKRVAGKQVFPPPGSGGSKPTMRPRPESLFRRRLVAWSQSQQATTFIPGPNRYGGRTVEIPLVDSNAKVTGQAWYGDDVRLPGELIGKILRSPHHYAKIKSIDTSRVEALPGVVAVATGQDAPNRFGVLPVRKDEHAMAVEGTSALATSLLASQPLMRRRRLKLCRFLTSSGKNSNPFLIPKRVWGTMTNPFIGEENITLRGPMSKSVSSGIWRPLAGEDAACVISWNLDHAGGSPRIYGAARRRCPLGPERALQLYTPQQVPHYAHRALSTVLDVPMHQINVVRAFVGGGFGGKIGPVPTRDVLGFVEEIRPTRSHHVRSRRGLLDQSRTAPEPYRCQDDSRYRGANLRL